MASSQIAASPAAPSRKELLEAGRRRLEEFRKRKAEERSRNATASSSEHFQSSKLKSSQIEQQGSVVANTQELNGSSFEKKPSKGTASSVFQSSSTTTSTVPLPQPIFNEQGVTKIFNDDNVKVNYSAAEPIYKDSAALSIVPGSVYGNRPQRSSHNDNDESDRQDIVPSNELNAGYMNSWRRSSSENISELLNKQEAKTVINDSTKVNVESINFYSDKAEQGVAGMKNDYLVSQVENFRNIPLGGRKGRAQEFLEKRSAEKKVSSRVFSKDADESWYSQGSQSMTHPSLLHLADDPGTKSQLDIHTGPVHISNSLSEPEISANNYSDEHMDFGNGKFGDEEAKVSGEGRKFLFSDRSSNKVSQNQDSLGAQLFSDTKNQPSPTLFPVVNSRRSRPSFLDSIAPSPPSARSQSVIAGSGTSKFMGDLIHKDVKNTTELNATSLWQSVNDEHEGLKKHDTVDSQLDFTSSQRNDDFAALEQHIEDLTREKFSLQRALDASRTLAESLAQENSSLTEAFNQQGTVVSQLKADLERQQEEIRAQLLVLNTLKMESENAQLECNAADERAKMLASEVISLEEKALRLRSNELKLERQLETVNDEIASNRRHISSLEKERVDLRSTIDALQEEKKLLQSKLRKAAANGSFDVHATTKPSKDIKDASTSTENIGMELFNFPVGSDLFLARHDDVTTIIPTPQASLSTVDVSQVLDTQSAGVVSSTNLTSSSFINSSSRLNSNQRSHMLDLPVAVPSDQQRMVDNINSLIDELASEKESLVRALKAESTEVTKLRDSNQELSRKLEAQTQRLELLISQNMAHDSSAAGPRIIESIHDEIEYVDEGDEVVERVLGWIMKLFPGGSSKRRTSKLL